MRRAAAGLAFLAVLAATPLWPSEREAPIEASDVTWAKNLDVAVERAARSGKALAILFR